MMQFDFMYVPLFQTNQIILCFVQKLHVNVLVCYKFLYCTKQRYANEAVYLCVILLAAVIFSIVLISNVVLSVCRCMHD